MKKNVLISVIIPVYNVEKYIEKCVMSIINQSYKNLEIILINDGSTDTSKVLCEKLKKKDSRIQLYTQMNSGLSVARNVGISHSNGRFITFIDSDDFIGVNHIMNLFTGISKYDADLCISKLKSIKYEHKNYKNLIVSNIIKMNKEETLAEMLKQKKFDTNACGKLFNAKLFSGIEFPPGMLYEDLDTMYKVIDQCSIITLVNTSDYYYVYHENSISNVKFNEKKMDILLITGELNKFIKERYPQLSQIAYARSMSAVINVWKIIDDSEDCMNEQILWDKIVEYSKGFSVGCNTRIKAKAAKIMVKFSKAILKNTLLSIDRCAR